MTGDLNMRLGKLEGTLSTVVVILEGEPVTDIDGVKIGTDGGLVKQGERHTEGLNVMSHQLDTILAQVQPRRWTRNQLIKMSMVVVVALGSISTIVWTL